MDFLASRDLRSHPMPDGIYLKTIIQEHLCAQTASIFLLHETFLQAIKRKVGYREFWEKDSERKASHSQQESGEQVPVYKFIYQKNVPWGRQLRSATVSRTLWISSAWPGNMDYTSWKSTKVLEVLALKQGTHLDGLPTRAWEGIDERNTVFVWLG